MNSIAALTSVPARPPPFDTFFQERFGMGPRFVSGSLRSAVTQARQTGKLLFIAVYDNEIMATEDLFGLLTDGTIRELLLSCVCWGFNMVGTQAYQLAQMAVEEGLDPEFYVTHPFSVALVADGVLMLKQFTVATDNVEFAGQLVDLISNFAQAREEKMQARDQTRELLSEQDRAYQESLAADRKKDAERAAEQQRQREAQAKEDAAAKKLEDEILLKQRQKEDAVARVAPEPSAANAAYTFSFTLPGGKAVKRAFESTALLQDVNNFLWSLDIDPAFYHVFTASPRNDLSARSPFTPLADLGLSKRERVFVERIDSVPSAPASASS